MASRTVALSRRDDRVTRLRPGELLKRRSLKHCACCFEFSLESGIAARYRLCALEEADSAKVRRETTEGFEVTGVGSHGAFEPQERFVQFSNQQGLRPPCR